MTIGTRNPRSQRQPHPIDNENARSRDDDVIDLEIDSTQSGALVALAGVLTVFAVLGVFGAVILFLRTASERGSLSMLDVAPTVYVFAASLSVYVVAAIVRGIAGILYQNTLQTAILTELLERRNRSRGG